jgi:hypothetical protein
VHNAHQAHLARAAAVSKAGKSLLFLKKKKQKDFCQFGSSRSRPRASYPMSKSFLLLFFKKEDLA